jgi:FkbM family methyltransferase
MHTGLSRRIVIHLHGFQLRFYPTNATAQQWIEPHHQHCGAREEAFLRRYLRAGDVVVDAGANIGLTALQAWSLVGPTGEVRAFEPHPRIFGYLMGNIELNQAQQTVTAYNLALGDSSGTAWLTDRSADDQNAVATASNGLRVPMVTLDEAVADIRSISLLKIDVEGYEWHVLQGAKGTLAKTDCVYFESHDEALGKYGCSLGDIVRFLAGQGFHVRRLENRGRSTPVGENDGSAEVEDLVAVRDVAVLHARLEPTPTLVEAES